MRSQERESIEDVLKLSCNVFDQLGQSRGEDMRTHLESRHNSATSRRRKDHPIISPKNDEINKLKAGLEKLAAKNTEAAPSTSTSALVRRFSRRHCLLDSECQPWRPTRERLTLKTTWTFWTTKWTCSRSLPSRCRCFAVILSGIAKKWIRQIEPETIVS